MRQYDQTKRTVDPTGPWWGLGLLLVLTAITRILTAEHLPTGLDSGNFMLGILDPSVMAERPHSPGYPVYVFLARSLHLLVHNTHASLLILSVLFSLLAVAATYLLARYLMGGQKAVLAAALLAANPLFWYNGSVAETYTFDAALAPAVILALLRCRSRRQWLVLGIGMGLAAGVRPTSLVLLAPAMLVVLIQRYRPSNEPSAGSVMNVLPWLPPGMAVGVLAWLIPSVINEGGVGPYLRAVMEITHNSRGSIGSNATALASTLVWTLSVSVLVIAFGWRRLRQLPWNMLLWWTLPPTLFFGTMHYQKGYFLLVLPAVCLGVAAASWRGRLPWVGGAAVAAVWMATFLVMPYHQPPDMTGLPRSNRGSFSTRDAVLGRLFSVYQPSLQRIRTSDRAIADAEALVASIPKARDARTLVVVDRVARLWVQARVLQARAAEGLAATDGVIFADIEPGDALTLTLYPDISKHHNVHLASTDRVAILTRTTFAGRYDTLVVLHREDHQGFTLLQVRDPRSAEQRLQELFAQR